MKKFPLAIITFAIISTLLFTSCRKDEYETPYMTLTTNQSGYVGGFLLVGSGEVTINWGDDTPLEIFMLGVGGVFPTIYHQSSSPPHVITITGDSIITLLCNSMQLTGLDVRRNTALTSLWCTSNSLTSLDISWNTRLNRLNCWSNQLTRLDVSKNTALQTLDCRNNQLTSLDVSKNPALISLTCDNNQLTRLDVSKNNTVLRSLHCSYNLLQTHALNALFHSLPVVSAGTIWITGNPGTETCNRSIATAKGWNVVNL